MYRPAAFVCMWECWKHAALDLLWWFDGCHRLTHWCAVTANQSTEWMTAHKHGDSHKCAGCFFPPINDCKACVHHLFAYILGTFRHLGPYLSPTFHPWLSWLCLQWKQPYMYVLRLSTLIVYWCYTPHQNVLATAVTSRLNTSAIAVQKCNKKNFTWFI